MLRAANGVLLRRTAALCSTFLLILSAHISSGCQFYPTGEYLKFVRIAENLRVGSDVVTLEVHPRSHLTIIPVDKEDDSKFFAYKDLNKTHIGIVLAKSLEDLVDNEAPRNLLKFRLGCDYTDSSNSLISSHLSVTVYVEDVNDHAPQFVDAPYSVAVDELSPVGSSIFRAIHALDKDKPGTPNSDVHYAILKGNEAGKFALEPGRKTALILRKPLDYDSGDREFKLVIGASDRGTPPRANNATLSVKVLDSDDLDPKFSLDIYRTQIVEFYPLPSRSIHREIEFPTPIRAVDQDRELDAPVRYDIISGNDAGTFHLDPRNGSLFLERGIDLDAERNLPGNTFVLQIRAVQTDNPAKLASARLEIEVLDLNDNLPEFEVDFYNISIVENLPNGFSVLQVVAYDRDQGENGEFAYELRDPSGAFAVEPDSGWLTVQDQSVLDREKKSFLQMKVLAVERRPSVVRPSNGSSTVAVEVTLLDANDNNPVFVPSNLMEMVARSDFKLGTIIGQVHAVDKDLGPNGQVRYRLQRPGGNQTNAMGGGGGGPFVVNPETGVISVGESPLPEGRHAIFVEASDQPANPSERRFSLAVATIDVFRADSQASRTPDFLGAPYEFWVGANVPVGTSVGQIRVNEAAKGKDVVYDLLHSYHEGVPFAVEERSGTITVVDEIEHYKRPMYEFEATVANDKNLNLVTNVSVHVVDPADDGGGIFARGTTRAPLVFHVRENAAGAFIGQVVPLNASSSTLKSVRFLIANQQDVSEIAITETGDLYTPTGLDRERRQNYSLTAIAEGPRGVGVFPVVVIVDDEDDNAPVFSATSYKGRILENSPVGSEVMTTPRIFAKDPDEDASFGLSLRGEGSALFRIDQSSGRVFFNGNGSHQLDREEKSVYQLRVVAGEGKRRSSNASLTIQVEDQNDNSPSFVQMVILPEQGVRVSRDEPPGESASARIGPASSATDQQRSPLLYVPENATIGSPLVRLVARDPDEGRNAELSYSLLSESGLGLSGSRRRFVVDSRSGELGVASTLPAETDLQLELVVKDGGGLADNLTLRLRVLDVNDHAPTFRQSWYSFDVPEGSYQRLQIGRVEATDADFGANANVSYELFPTSPEPGGATFEISRLRGGVSVSGVLDREARELYTFKVVARDNGTERLASSADLEIRVQDANDNAPTFYGHQETTRLPRLLPVYYASVPENSQPGTVVGKLFANDSDSPANGNGLVLYDLATTRGRPQLFAVDGKEGLVTTIGQLDYETQSVHNLTVTASDLGSPSLTSTALLVVRLLDVDEGPEEPRRASFQHRYYELEVDENAPVPLRLLQLNASLEGRAHEQSNEQLRFSIVQAADGGGGDARDHFALDPKNGSLHLLISPDRELRDRFELRVRVDKVKTARGMPVMIYPVAGERLSGLGPNEAKVVLKIKDVNDNAPRFRPPGRPVVAAVSTAAQYGHVVTKLQADDPDEGVNGQVRYRILGKRDDSAKFAIDPVSGQVQTAASFAKDAGRVFAFDVKAVDKAGAEDGRSSVVSVFVYVLDHNKQLVMVMGKKPGDIEAEIGNITSVLQNVTGLDVRVRKVEPHTEKNSIDISSSDMYLYAIDPSSNVMVDTDTLQNVLKSKKSQIKRELERYKLVDIGGGKRRTSQHYLLSTLELSVVALGCVVFVSALVTALCVACVRRHKRRQPYGSSMFHAPVGFALEPGGSLQKSSIFPSYVGGFHQYDPAASFSGEMRQHSYCEHEPNCVRFHSSCSNASLGGGAANGNNAVKRGVRRTGPNMETSATSLHSSGQDSGIVAGTVRPCQCSNSSSPSSGESSNGYEDSLKSLHHQHHHRGHQHRPRAHDGKVASNVKANASNNNHNNNPKNPSQLSRKRHRFHSFTNLETIYHQPEPSGMQCEPRDRLFQTALLEQKPRQSSSHPSVYSAAHRRTYSEAENLNNITETIIQEHPLQQPRSLGSCANLPVAPVSFLHGKGKTLIATAAGASVTATSLLRPGDGAVYARARRNFT